MVLIIIIALLSFKCHWHCITFYLRFSLPSNESPGTFNTTACQGYHSSTFSHQWQFQKVIPGICVLESPIVPTLLACVPLSSQRTESGFLLFLSKQSLKQRLVYTLALGDGGLKKEANRRPCHQRSHCCGLLGFIPLRPPEEPRKSSWGLSPPRGKRGEHLFSSSYL